MPLDMLTTPSGKKALLHPRKTMDDVLEDQKNDPLHEEYHHEKDLEEVAEIESVYSREYEQQRLRISPSTCDLLVHRSTRGNFATLPAHSAAIPSILVRGG